ncbi:ATP-binding cassette domain-containing protein [Candidatus Woesearchaeota archaeon]|nr:ATP-binding cassette domain-containing protein [Candidatus Woesearchaeota archaeon]
MVAKTIIELKDVWKIYKMGKVEVPALQGVNLKIKRREFLAIMGPSGSGKSTLMYMVGALDTPTKGSILLDNKDIAKMSESKLAQIRGRKIGFVFQRFNLIPSLTALENVILPMAFQKVSEEKRNKKAKEYLELVGLKERMSHKPTELSGGERQRVSIARALSNDPEVILADEPTGNLDSKTGDHIMKLLVDLHVKKKKTIIVVTHDADIANYADRKIVLKDGKVLKDGRHHKIYAAE